MLSLSRPVAALCVSLALCGCARSDAPEAETAPLADEATELPLAPPGQTERDALVQRTAPDSLFDVTPAQWAAVGGEPYVSGPASVLFRHVADFDGDGRDDVVLGSICGVHLMCPFEMFLSAESGYVHVGTLYASGDGLEVCPQRSGAPRVFVHIWGPADDIGLWEHTVRDGSIREEGSWALRDGERPPPNAPRGCGVAAASSSALGSEWVTRGDAAWKPERDRLTFLQSAWARERRASGARG